ncbi:hypothetical protein FEE95_10120 [Maribacter algarum]|uniref:Glycoside hydrolase n=1 Tax=Maribacter algarum (ex Zhang et al. 2020) TaxID=2578118 RepID=A0A5S3PQ23_9FLAO|nr:hypothetical protein [Maribacter algarum]TMM56847.1 hypothetical protein FEE95_10120 [Maribacter algarum]
MKSGIKHFLMVYVILWLIAFVVISFLLSRGERSFLDSSAFFFEIASSRRFLIAFHIVFLLCYSLFLSARYFRKVFLTKGKTIFLKQLSFRFILPILLVFTGYKTLAYSNTNDWYTFDWDATVMNENGHVKNLYDVDKKHRGMSVFGWSEDNQEAIDNLVHANVEWVAVIPFLYQKDEKTKLVDIPENPEVYTRRDSSHIRAIQDLHKKGIRVQLKPHLWMNDGWRSNITLDNEVEWEAWFESYRTNILRYARIAEVTDTELFCVGTELKTSIKKQPQKWENLIGEIRQIYSGELTYAANWYDEYEHISFWKDLDYIGIQAYFPLTKVKNPDLKTIEKGWEKHLTVLESFHKKYDKPILFTEVGYRSDADATIKPWEWNQFFGEITKKKSDQTQQLAYEALFNKTWHQPWFAGVYIWQWDNRTMEESAQTDLDFSPRFKPAENILAKWFGKSSNDKL